MAIMKEKKTPHKDSSQKSEEDWNTPLNNKLEGFFFKMRTLEVENEELKQEIQSLTFRAKEEANDIKKFYEKTIENYVNQSQKDALSKSKAEQEAKILLEKLLNSEKEIEMLKQEKQVQQQILQEIEEESRSLRIQVKRLREDIIREEEKSKYMLEACEHMEELKKNHEKAIQDWETQLLTTTEQLHTIQSREQRWLEQIDRLQRELTLNEKMKKDMEEGFRKRLNETLAERLLELRRNSEIEAQRMKEELKDLYNEKIIQISKQREEDLELKFRLETENESLNEKVEESQQELKQKSSLILDLQQSLNTLQKQHNQKYELIEKDLIKRESILNSKETQLKSREKKCEEILEHNLILQAEIRTYHKLLKAEEDRSQLNSPLPSSRKRARTTDDLLNSNVTTPHHYAKEYSIKEFMEEHPSSPLQSKEVHQGGSCNLM